MPEVVTDLSVPEDMTGLAADLWRDLAVQLHSCGILTVADLPTFARYVRMYALYDEVMRDAERDPTKEKIIALAKVDDMLRRLEATLGLTPSARTGISKVKPETGKGVARFFDA